MTGSPAVPASGRQIRLRAGAMAATVTEVGASLRELTTGGRPLVAAYGRHEIAAFANGQALVPWPNRVADGAYEFAGQTHQLPLSEPEQHNAIHGLARWLSWRIDAADADRAVLSIVLPPQAGYPFRLEVEVEYGLSPGGLRVQTTAHNRGGQPLPYGCGFHPYLTVGTDSIDEALLSIPAAAHLEVDERGIPTGVRLPVAGDSCDFRAARQIGDTTLDTVFGDLRRDPGGHAVISLRAPAGPAVSLWMDDAHPYVMAFTGDTLPKPHRRRSLAVEPMTCAPNALRSGDGLHTLEPGESFVSRWGIEAA